MGRDLHNVVGLQPGVWWGVDEDIGQGVLLVVHLICRGGTGHHRAALGAASAQPGQGHGAHLPCARNPAPQSLLSSPTPSPSTVVGSGAQVAPGATVAPMDMLATHKDRITSDKWPNLSLPPAVASASPAKEHPKGPKCPGQAQEKGKNHRLGGLSKSIGQFCHESG